MKIKTILITTEAGAELEFENLEIESLAMLDPWLSGAVSGKIKAKGLGMQAERDMVPALPVPHSSHLAPAERKIDRGMTLHLLQFMALESDKPKSREEIITYLARSGFRNTNSVGACVIGAKNSGYVTSVGVGLYKLTERGRQRAMDPRLKLGRDGKIHPAKREVAHVHVGEGIIKSK